jgi:hypothetical protein
MLCKLELIVLYKVKEQPLPSNSFISIPISEPLSLIMDGFPSFLNVEDVETFSEK